MTETKGGVQTQAGEPRRSRGPGREGKSMIGAYVDKGALYTIQELLLRLSRDRGERVTMQEALTEALGDFCRKHGVELKLTS